MRNLWGAAIAVLMLLPCAAWAQASCTTLNSSTGQYWQTDQYGHPCVNAGITGSTPTTPSYVAPAQVTTTTPDVTTITTGGTAVTACAANHSLLGGFILNPPAATEALCVYPGGTAGTTATGGTAYSCIAAGQNYTLPATAQAVSVNAATSGHNFSAGCFR